MKKLFTLIISLFLFGLANAQVSNARINFSCPTGQVTVTYDLNTSQPIDVTLYYSHNKRDWFIAQTVTGDITEQTSGTGKTIIWDCFADNVRLGRFYFKIEIPPPPESKCVWINGVCWAKYNVGAPDIFVENPVDAGMFYQWNRNIGWNATDPMINSNGETTWTSSIPTGTIWTTTNNVCPDGWRIPTETEFASLISSGSIWTTSPVPGRIFGSGNNTIFLPAVGYRRNVGGFLYAEENGCYWSSIQNSSSYAYSLGFDSDSAYVSYLWGRAYGLSVRCVAEQSEP